MAGFRIEGNTSGNVAEVDSNNNIKVNLPLTETQAGYATMIVENDPGASGVTGGPSTRYMETLKATEDRKLQVSPSNPIFDDVFNMSAQNTGVWKFSAGTTAMAATLGSGFLTLNSGSVLTTAAAAGYQTQRYFSVRGDGQIEITFTAALSAAMVANQIHEVGLFVTTATGASPTAPTDGVYLQMTTAGLIGVLNFNGTPTQVGPWTGYAVPSANVNQTSRIIITQRTVEFWTQAQAGPMAGELVFLGEINVPSGNAIPFLSESLPLTFQSRNTGTVSGTPGLMKVAACTVTQQDVDFNMPFPQQQSMMGLNGSQGTDGGTMGSTAVLTNSATAAAAALVNTTASAQFTGLGGAFLVLPTLTAGTDGLLCSFQVPVGSTSQTAKALVIHGVSISSGVQTALTGGPLNLVYSLAYGHTATSLATTESGSLVSPQTKVPRRKAIGVQNYVVTAAAGVESKDLIKNWAVPVTVNPGEFVAIAVRNMGTVTTAGALSITVDFDCEWV